MAQIDLSPDVLDLVLYAGDGVRFRLVAEDVAEAPVPLLGTFEAEIRAKRPDPDPVKAQFTIDTTDAATGIIGLSLTGTQTQLLVSAVSTDKKWLGVWDVQWTPVDSEPKTLCQGKVTVWRDVSR